MSSNSPTEPSPATKRQTGRRLLVRGAFICALLLTFVCGFYLVENARGRAAWKHYEEEARARHVKLAMADFVPAPIPDDRNFAAIPIFQHAFEQLDSPAPFALPGSDSARRPPLGSVMKDQMPDLKGWQKLFVDAKILPNAGDNAAADVLKALEYYAPQFEQLRAAAARPDSRFPVRYEDGPSARLPHLQIIRTAAQLNALRLVAHLEAGESAAAYDDFRLGLRFYTALGNEATLIAGLVRVSVLGLLENGVWAGLVRGQWGAPEIEKIGTDLAGIRIIDDYVLSMGSERAGNNLIYEQLAQKGPGLLGDLVEVQPAPGKGARLVRALYALYPAGWLHLNQTRTNRYFDEMMTRVSQDPPRVYPERPVPNGLPGSLAEVGKVERLRYFLFFLLAPVLNEIERTYGSSQALLDQTRLACALERYRLARGSFPKTLDALAPAYLSMLPRDVMTGGPLHYRSSDDGGYVLYSVAWNLQDDGGKSDPEANAKKQLDWVWKMAAK